MSSTLGNPFATRHTRPGALSFRFPAGEDEAALVERLRSQGWWGQIVGPHGSGKSTLLAALASPLERPGRRVRLVTLHQGERRLPFTSEDWKQLNPRTQLVIDGYEQLGRLARWSLVRRCRRQGCGLLVATHRPLGLATIFQTRPGFELALELVHALLPPGDAAIRDCDVEAAWRRRGGDVRELLFDLYDLFERRRGES